MLYWARSLVLLGLIPALNTAGAAGFGIFDARTLSMGGASVAAHRSKHALFYNPALLAFNDEFEEKNLEGRVHFPSLIGQVSESLIDIEQLNSDNLDGRLSQAIADFNTAGTPETASAAAAASSNLRDTVLGLAGDDLLADGFFGFAVAEPSRLEGGGVFVGVRVVGGGRSNVTEADRTLLDEYVDGLNFIASGGTQGTAQPQLFDANGNLIDPNDAFDSSLNGRGAAITEVGIAMSKMLYFWGKPVALGITPKLMAVDTFDETTRVVDNRLGSGENSITHASFNMDVGVAMDLGTRYRVGLAIKDTINREWATGTGTEVKLAPRARLGVGAQFAGFNVGVDADLVTSDPIADEFPVRETAVGIEWDFRNWLKIRGGYRHDLEGNREGITSGGLGFRIKRWYIDLSYAQGGDLQAGALQFSYAI